MAAAPHADPRLLHYWTLLEEEEKRAALERQKLREMWTKINIMQENNDAARRTFEERASFDFVPGNTRISLNVGGEIFETTANVLCQDRFCLLATLCRQNPPKPFERDPSGSFFLDRDWWIFRHILQFLRTGRLPTDAVLLNELYEEASFYHLSLLRRAIKVRMVKGDGLQDPNTRMDEFGDRPRFPIAPQPK